MPSLTDLMKQAQAMQDRMQESQARLAETEISGEAGGGMVKVTLTGRHEAKKIQIDPKLFEGGDREILEDLLVAAFNDAHARIEAQTAGETEKMLGGLKLPPGFKMPF